MLVTASNVEVSAASYDVHLMLTLPCIPFPRLSIHTPQGLPEDIVPAAIAPPPPPGWGSALGAVE